MRHYFSGQPKGLYPLCFTELWERFGFYVVQTILVLYMSHQLGYSDTFSYLLYGAFSSLLYLTPVIGGYVADRILGFRQSIVIGGVLFFIGYAVMAIPITEVFFLGLSIVIVANGLFKPNVSSIVGDLYGRDDPRRDGGFTLFYMGINIGAVIPPIFAGPLVNTYGWHWGYLTAALGMVVALATFIGFRRKLANRGEVPATSPLRRGKKGLVYGLTGIIIVATIGLLDLLFRSPEQTNLILTFASSLIVLGLIYFYFKEKKEHRSKLLACLILILVSIGFWAVYIQTYTSLTLFADRNMSKEFLGFTIDAEFIQFFNPFFIIVLSPLLSGFWIWLSDRKKDPSTPAKFSLGILFMAAGFLFLGVGTRWFSDGGMSSPWWLASSYFLQTIGELLLSPIGLAMITRLTPSHLVGMMMGVWFLTQSAAFAIGGGLATWAAVPKGTTIVNSLEIYSEAFMRYGYLSLALAVISFFLIPYVKKLGGETHG
jgi:POT family proton-dependent oligopeptide transporter